MSDRRLAIILAGSALLILALTLAWVLTPAAPPPKPSPFIGAAALLKAMGAVTTAPPTFADPTAQLSAEVANFRDTVLQLPADDAARHWLALYDRVCAPAPRNKMDGVRSDLFNHPPAPAAWPMLEKLVDERPAPENLRAETVLHFYVHTLNNEEDKQWADLDALYQQEATPNSAWFALGQQLCQVASNGKKVAAFWDKAIALFEPPPPSALALPSNPAIAPMPPPRSTYGGATTTLILPDLVPLIGPDQTTALLQRALVLKSASVTIPRGTATQTLARNLALTLVDQIQQPPWQLTEAPEGTALFEALVKKFRDPETACTGPLFEKYSLIAQGRYPEALAVPIRIYDSGDFDRLENIAVARLYAEGHGPQLYDFYRMQIVQGKDVWASFLDVAGKLGRTDDALKTVREIQDNTALSDQARNLAAVHRFQMLLANDQVDEGLAALVQCRDLPSTAKDPKNTYPYFWLIETRCDMTLAAARVCHLTGRQAEFDRHMQLLVNLLQQGAATREDITDDELTDLSGTIALLIETNHTRDAEMLLHNLIETESAREHANLEAGQKLPKLQAEILLMTAYYYEGESWDDVLELLDHYPYWGESDLAGMPYDNCQLGDRSLYPIQLIAARVLAQKGRLDEARPILDEVLQVHPAEDKAYSLLLDITDDPIPKLDALYAEDRFEKRPLIWKAIVLLKAKKFDDAEKVCRQAIAIDPSDGAEGKIDRMRAYAVLAEILNAKGEKDEAARMQKIVDAIRASEDADDFYEAWLFTRAAKRYEDALALFSDAYCIESRLAKRLTDLGKTDEAAAHYRRAFELMPGSFGRMESHCFGCEGIFEGKIAQDTAEKVLLEMQAKEPEKAQIPYLLGMLRLEQGRYADAAPLFKKAVDLDPDYINAWSKLLELDQTEGLPAEVRDAAVLAKLRLDPQTRHGLPDLSLVRNLAAVMTARNAAATAPARWPEHLYPLAASRTLQEKVIAKKVQNDIVTRNFDLRLTGKLLAIGDAKPDPWIVLDRNSLVQLARQQWLATFDK